MAAGGLTDYLFAFDRLACIGTLNIRYHVGLKDSDSNSRHFVLGTLKMETEKHTLTGWVSSYEHCLTRPSSVAGTRSKLGAPASGLEVQGAAAKRFDHIR